jgi:hypothetical protein
MTREPSKSHEQRTIVPLLIDFMLHPFVVSVVRLTALEKQPLHSSSYLFAIVFGEEQAPSICHRQVSVLETGTHEPSRSVLPQAHEKVSKLMSQHPAQSASQLVSAQPWCFWAVPVAGGASFYLFGPQNDESRIQPSQAETVIVEVTAAAGYYRMAWFILQYNSYQRIPIIGLPIESDTS